MNLYVGFLDSFAIFLIGGIFISSGNAAITPIDTWSINLPRPGRYHRQCP